MFALGLSVTVVKQAGNYESPPQQLLCEHQCSGKQPPINVVLLTMYIINILSSIS